MLVFFIFSIPIFSNTSDDTMSYVYCQLFFMHFRLSTV